MRKSRYDWFNEDVEEDTLMTDDDTPIHPKSVASIYPVDESVIVVENEDDEFEEQLYHQRILSIL